MFEALKKTIGVCLIGIGSGILLVLLLPITGWLFIIGCAVFIMGIAWLFGKKQKKQFLRKDMISMKIVVKRVPKFLRGFVKLIFGLKDEK